MESTSGTAGTSADRGGASELARVRSVLDLLEQVEHQIETRLAAVMPAGLASRAVVSTLVMLDLDGPVRPGQIMQLTALTSGGVSRLLERLEKGGLVTRNVGMLATDRRSVLVKITPKGHRLCRRVSREVTDVLPEVQALLKRLTAAGRAG